MTEFKTYVSGRTVNGGFLNKDIQHLAFEAAVSQKKQNLMEAIFEVFQLADHDRRTDFIPAIEKMCSEANFKEVDS